MFYKEKGVPIPPAHVVNSKGYTAAVRSLEPGESVHLPITRNHARSIVKYLSINGERDGSEFVCRKDGKGARIWRR